jgi:hypothetical protein
MTIRYIFSTILLGALLASCATMPKNTEATSRQIVCGPGPEDIELDSSAGKPRMIISCAQRRESSKKVTYDAFGEIMEYGFDGKPATIMPRIGGPTGAMFNPHGFSIARVGGRNLLYVISHAKPSPKIKENHIEVYEIQGSNLLYVKTISGPELVSPNDCFATTDGDVFFTNDSGKGNYLWEKMWRLKKSTVYCVKADGTKHLVGSKMAYANGIYVIDTGIIGDWILKTPTGQDTVHYKYLDMYVSTVQQKALFKKSTVVEMGDLDKLYNNKPNNILPVFGQDNIMRCGNNLVVACHPKPIKFLKHALNPKKLSPTHFYTVDITTGQYQCIFVDDGSRVSTGSTAILYKGKLYVSQVFQPYVLEVDIE